MKRSRRIIRNALSSALFGAASAAIVAVFNEPSVLPASGTIAIGALVGLAVGLLIGPKPDTLLGWEADAPDVDPIDVDN